jgi:hypothetical protein
MKQSMKIKRPDWARTHHTKPRRVAGRRERQQLRQIAQVAR